MILVRACLQNHLARVLVGARPSGPRRLRLPKKAFRPGLRDCAPDRPSFQRLADWFLKGHPTAGSQTLDAAQLEIGESYGEFLSVLA